MNNQNNNYNIENTAELMTGSGKGKRTAGIILATVAIVAVLAIAAVSIKSIVKKPSLSEQLPGKWVGEYDVSQRMMSELSDIAGTDLSFFKPRPVYCYYILEFDENGNYALYLDKESLVSAIGEFIKPIVNFLLDTEIGDDYDALLPFLADDLPLDSDYASGTYQVDEEAQKILVFKDDEYYSETIYIDSKGYLRFENPDIAEGVAFSKE